MTRTAKLEEKIEMICKKLRKNKVPETIAEELEEDFSYVTQICDVAQGYAPEYDSREIYEKWKETV